MIQNIYLKPGIKKLSFSGRMQNKYNSSGLWARDRECDVMHNSSFLFAVECTDRYDQSMGDDQDGGHHVRLPA